MIIANPIYDVVFKRLMENDRVAKFFIGTLLDETIESVEAQPQELTYHKDELRGFALFRLDFVAVIKTADGKRKKILVEIQKAQKKIDLMRFRNYLAEQYKKEDIVDGEQTLLPITTIYILGFTLPDIETACIKVERNYKDLINKTIITKKSSFIESLTHDSYVVQTGRITDRYQTRLDKLLSIFEQAHFIDDKRVVKQYKHEPDEEEVKLITDILHHSGTEPEERKLIELEQEALRTFNAMIAEEERKFLKKMEENAKAMEEKDKALEENAKAIEEKDKALGEKDKEIEDLKRRLNLKGQ
jgi:hypothetical protein